jgi:hypothetical protein
MRSTKRNSSSVAVWLGVGDAEATAPDDRFDRGFAADLISRKISGGFVARLKPCRYYKAAGAAAPPA